MRTLREKTRLLFVLIVVVLLAETKLLLSQCIRVYSIVKSHIVIYTTYIIFIIFIYDIHLYDVYSSCNLNCFN